MSEEQEPTEDELRLVVKHGSGPFVRALAAVRLARRMGKTEELLEIVRTDVEGD